VTGRTLPSERCDVVIGGGGVAGLALACVLGDVMGAQGRIVVAERAKHDGERGQSDNRAWAVSAGSRRLLEAIGAWQHVASHAQPVSTVDISDSSLNDATRPILVSYDNRIANQEPATYIVESGRLHAALLAAAQARASVVLACDNPIVGFASGPHAVTITLVHGGPLSAALLVAADGRSSRLREMAGIKIVRWDYAQIGIVTTVHHERPHNGRAVQHFLPAGPFAILPLRGDRSCITWTQDSERGREILALDDAGFLAEVERRFGHRLGALALVGGRDSWPLDTHLARALIADRFALLGDAAHGVHPIAGQGLNLGLRDVAALAEVIADAARVGLDIGALTVLARYQRWRRLDAAVSAATFDALNRFFSNDVTLLRSARDFGLGLVERMPALKQFLVTEAAGLTGDVPKLLRGERV
jgi:2-octaprenyl-6-methoxyphenol hydroxylase